MRRRAAKDDERVLVFKATASDWEGRVRGMPYRVIAIPEKMSLYNLAENEDDDEECEDDDWGD